MSRTTHRPTHNNIVTYIFCTLCYVHKEAEPLLKRIKSLVLGQDGHASSTAGLSYKKTSHLQAALSCIQSSTARTGISSSPFIFLELKP